MRLSFAAIADAQVVELSADDVALVSGGGWEWGVQDPNAGGPTGDDPTTDSWDWC